MPGFASRVSDDEAAQLATFERSGGAVQASRGPFSDLQ